MSHYENTIDEVRLPLPIRLVNRVGKNLQRLGFARIPLTVESLLATARERTKLSDFGDPEFLVGLRILLGDLERHGNLSFLGRFLAQQNVLRMLCNRLRIADDLKRHPEILDVPIERPLFIVGLPRTGTTLLHNLLAQIPGVRVPLLWELRYPSPPPLLEERESDLRIAAVRREMKILDYLGPQLSLMHRMSAETPDECIHLLDLTFSSSELSCMGESTPQYYAWILEKDRVPDYRYFRQLLQLLKWRCPGEPWIFKSPVHLSALDALCTVFPDANIVHTHRDPRQVVGSLCSLTGSARSINCERIDRSTVGQQELFFSAGAMDRALQARASLGPDRFIDVHYSELTRDPLGMARTIFERFGYPLPPTADARMQRWLDENRQHKLGVHKYTAETFGLTPEVIDRRFAEYVERFGIVREQPRRSVGSPP